MGPTRIGFVLLLLASFYGSNIHTVTFIIGITSWTDVCRLVRAEFLSLREKEFVEAARGLAVRTMQDGEDDRDRMRTLFRRCTAREPDEETIDRAVDTLAAFRARYAAEEDDAGALLGVGEAMLPEDADPAELAAWTLVANAVLNLYETTTQH